MGGAALLTGGGVCLAGRVGGGGDVLIVRGTGSDGTGGSACSMLGLVSLDVAALLPASCLKYVSR